FRESAPFRYPSGWHCRAGPTTRRSLCGPGSNSEKPEFAASSFRLISCSDCESLPAAVPSKRLSCRAVGPFTIMRMRNAYLLIFLSIWIHFDDVLLTAFPRLQYVPLAADDDQYVLVKPQQRLNCFCSRPKAENVGLKPEIADFFPVCTGSSASFGSK